MVMNPEEKSSFFSYRKISGNILSTEDSSPPSHQSITPYAPSEPKRADDSSKQFMYPKKFGKMFFS